MTTAGDIALKIAKRTGRASVDGTSIIDNESEILDAISETVRYYNRMSWALQEVLDATLTTANGTKWYSAVDLSTGEAPQVIAGRTEVSVSDIIDIDYIRDQTSGLEDDLCRVDYRQFERWSLTSSPGGFPYAWTRYADRIGIYPTPDAAYTLTISCRAKPTVPTGSSDTSVWFDQAEDIIAAGAAKWFCSDILRDPDRASEFAAKEMALLEPFKAELVRKTATGRLKPNSIC